MIPPVYVVIVRFVFPFLMVMVPVLPLAKIIALEIMLVLLLPSQIVASCDPVVSPSVMVPTPPQVTPQFNVPALIIIWPKVPAPAVCSANCPPGIFMIICVTFDPNSLRVLEFI